jgi:hypothetical protein
MKTEKEEFIKFFAYLNRNGFIKNLYVLPEQIIDNYLINSEAQIETPNVNNNEAKGKNLNTIILVSKKKTSHIKVIVKE